MGEGGGPTASSRPGALAAAANAAAFYAEAASRFGAGVGSPASAPFLVGLDGVFDLVVATFVRGDAVSDPRTLGVFRSEIVLLVAEAMNKSGVRPLVSAARSSQRPAGGLGDDPLTRPFTSEDDNDMVMISTGFFL